MKFGLKLYPSERNPSSLIIAQDVNLKTRLRLVATSILFIGLVTATFTYLRATNQPDDSSNPDIQHSKRYVRSLRLYGGELAITEDEICRWFKSLWQGTSLSYTIACITILTSGGFFLTAHHVSAQAKGSNSNERSEL